MGKTTPPLGARCPVDVVSRVVPMDIDFAGQKNAEAPDSGRSLASEFWRATVQAAVIDPINGLSQLANRIRGEEAAGPLDPLMARSPGANWGSARWHAEVAGTALGSLVPFLIVNRGVKTFLGTASSSTGALLGRRSALGLSLQESALTGFSMDFLAKSVEPGVTNFWSERLLNGAGGALNFTALTAGSMGIAKLGIKHNLAIGALSGIPAGFVGSQFESLRRHNEFASLEEIGKSIYVNAYCGVVLGARERYLHNSAVPMKEPDAVKKPLSLSFHKPISLTGVLQFHEPVRISESGPTPNDAMPRVQPESRMTDSLSYEEAMQLSRLRSSDGNAAAQLEAELAARGRASEWMVRHNYIDGEMGAKSFVELTEQSKQVAQAMALIERSDSSRDGNELPASVPTKFGDSPISIEEANALVALRNTPAWGELATAVLAKRGPAARFAAETILTGSDLVMNAHDVEVLTAAYCLHSKAKEHLSGSKSLQYRQEISLCRLLKFENSAEIESFVRLRERLPEPTGTAYKDDLLHLMSRSKEVLLVPDALLPAVHEHLISTLDSPLSAAKNREANPFAGFDLGKCAQLWQLEPRLPPELAQEAAELSPINQVAAALAWRDALSTPLAEKVGAGRPLSALMLESYRTRLESYSLERRTDLIAKLNYKPALPRAVDIVHGKALNAAEQHALSLALRNAAQPFVALTEIKGGQFRDALNAVNPSGGELTAWQPRAAAGLATVFKGAFPAWLAAQRKFGRDIHDSTYWLPVELKANTQGLDAVLFANGGKEPRVLELVAKNWKSIPESLKKQNFDSMREWVMSRKFPDHKNVQFAAEASQWGIEPAQYRLYEERYLASQSVPSPFPVDCAWSSGGLTGRFLPRNDPRGLFIGPHTNSCQHPEGTAQECAWHGQENPSGGFFVVENAQREIVAGSWVWVSARNEVVFDNCEAKGLGPRQGAALDVYKKAADHLLGKHSLVTIGIDRGGLEISTLPEAGALTVPIPQQSFPNYTDARKQAILAKKD